MNKLISPYDLGNSQIVERTQRVSINTFVRRAQKGIKSRILQAQIEALGIPVQLTTSKTRFNGDRFWFICPFCNKKVGILYKHPLQAVLGCRLCLDLKYQKQRFKGMLEGVSEGF